MFDFVYQNKRIVQVILALLIIPFAFVGVDYVFRQGDSSVDVARIGREKITQQEFDDAIRQQQDQMRRMFGRNPDPGMFDNPEVRFSVVENLISERLLRRKSKDLHFVVSDEQLRNFLEEIPSLQEDGKFSQTLYERLIANQNMSVPQFEQRLRQDLSLQPIREVYLNGGFVSDTNTARYIQLSEQQREVVVATVDSAPFLTQVQIDDALLKNHYDANQNAFQMPEQVRIEYVMLSPELVNNRVMLDAQAVRKFYDEHIKDYSQPEQRQASHILIEVKSDASEDSKAAAKKKAEEVFQSAKKTPNRFAELAKQYSQDPGSAQQGGDLGMIGKGMMVKPFEDAVFSMRLNDIVGPIETNFGYHVIKLTGIQAERIKAFDEVKTEIEQEFRRQEGSKLFAELAENLQNRVYEQADSLEPIAKDLQLTLRQSPWITRTQAQAIGRNNQKFVQAVFAPESIQNKRNTEAIEIGNNALIAARVLEHKPTATRPFEEVKEEIRRQLQRKTASELAVKLGQEKLALLTTGKENEAKLNWGKTQLLKRQQRLPGFNETAVQQIFRVPENKLPAYIGVNNDAGGFSIYKVTQVLPVKTDDENKLKTARGTLGQQKAQELFNAYVANLKKQAEVKINEKNVEKKER